MSASNIDSTVQPREWHVTANTGKLGPLTLAEVAALAASGRIAPRSLAWKSGMASWQPCGLIPELAPLFGHIQPPAEVWGARLRALWIKLRGIEAEVRPHIKRVDTSKFRLTRRQWKIASFILITISSYWVWRNFIHVPAHDELVGLFSGSFPADPRSEFARLSKKEGRTPLVVMDTARVEKRDGDYVLYEKLSGKWAGPQKMTPMESKALSDLFGEEWMEFDPIGLVNPTGQTAVIRAPEGWEPEDFECSSGYILLKPSGPIEIMKKSAEPSAPTLPTLRAKIEPTPTPEPTPELSEDAGQKKVIGRAQKSKALEVSGASKSNTASTDQPPAKEPAQTLKLPSARLKGSKKSPASDTKKTAPASTAPEPEQAPEIQAASVAPQELTRASVSQNETANGLRPADETNPKSEPMSESSSFVPHAEVSTESIPMSASTPSVEQTPTPKTTPTASAVTSMPEAAAVKSSDAKTETPKSANSDAAISAAQKRAADSRARLASLSASGRTTLREEFLKNGDAFLKTSRERAATKDSEGAVFYAERAEATFRQGEQAVNGGK